jgi:GNAT superfamily N-acetyltransferase
VNLQLGHYDQFWIDYLGVKPSEWDVPGVSVNAHVGLGGYRGVWFFIRRKRLVISAPQGWVPHLRRSIAVVELDTTNIKKTKFHALFGASFDRCIGPVFQGSLVAECFSPFESANVRELTPHDSGAVDTFRAECMADELSVSGIDKTTLYRTAFFNYGRIVALSGYRPWSDTVGDPCVLTHPEYRTQGCGAAVVSMTVKLALNEGKVPLYQTLESNVGAVKIARRLGYERYAQHFAVRLNTDAPSTPLPTSSDS